jgi:hypothetical protein
VRRSIPVSLGILVTVGIGILLGGIVPAYALVAAASVSCTCTTDSVGTSAWCCGVYRRSRGAWRFLRPALVLTVLGWAAVVYFSYDIARLAKDPDWGEFALWNLLGLLLYLTAATIGALFGGQFYTRRPSNRPAAAR